MCLIDLELSLIELFEHWQYDKALDAQLNNIISVLICFASFRAVIQKIFSRNWLHFCLKYQVGF